MGATVGGYYSDITRTYVFGEATQRQREIWNLERATQDAVFNAARLGSTCESLDFLARASLEKGGLGPGYKTPGLPHRTGHGLGLNIHEHPYIVKGNKDLLTEGMCFSNEPMICIYGEFGVRLEDHIYMTSKGANWFTRPAHSIDDPFGQDL
jgi:Xaa-Pro dipeptidase